MRAESIAFAVAGILFGLIVGWVLGSQQGGPNRMAPPMASASAPAPPARTPPPPALDSTRVQTLRTVADQNPRDPQPRVDLGNLYFDAQQYKDAILWYESAIQLNPKDPNVSTDLGVAYYYESQPDRALRQFEHSLSVDPNHTKTLLNMGIVKAFGKQDLNGAVEAWKRVISLAPDSPEGQAARRALEGMEKAHPPGSGTSGSSP
jgi:cytochrome c-type biogenesis protein CcmH/NrfG